MRRILITTIATMLLVSGCATKIKTYEGPEKLMQDIALIKCNPYVQVNGVDGNKSHRVSAGGGLWYRDCEISVLPGPHTFDVCFDESYSTGTMNVTRRCGQDIPVQIDAQAGRIYRIKYESKSGRWKPWIEDVTEEELAKIEEERRNQAAEKK